MRWVLVAALLSALIPVTHAAPVPKQAPKDEKIDVAKLIGKWKAKTPNAHEEFEFADGGKVTRSIQLAGTHITDVTSYTTKDKLLAMGPTPIEYTILKLTETEMVLQGTKTHLDRTLTFVKEK